LIPVIATRLNSIINAFYLIIRHYWVSIDWPYYFKNKKSPMGLVTCYIYEGSFFILKTTIDYSWILLAFFGKVDKIMGESVKKEVVLS